MVNSVDGFAMFLNLKRLKQLENFKNNKFFDEKIFLYLENDDLCKRIIKNNGIACFILIVLHKSNFKMRSKVYVMSKVSVWLSEFNFF